MTNLTFLGVEGYPQGNRETISILVEHNNIRMLLDCGGSIIRQLDRRGLKASDIDGVFISHLHADHSSGLPILLYSILMERFEQRASGPKVIAILGEQVLLEPLIGYCKAAYPALFTVDNPVRANLRHLDFHHPFEFENGITIDSAPMSHTVKGASIALTCENIRICYTADTRQTDDLEELAQGSQVLICNVFGCDETVANQAGFLSATGAAKLAVRVGASKLIMLHLYCDVDRAKALEAAKTIFSGDIVVPTNGVSMTLD